MHGVAGRSVTYKSIIYRIAPRGAPRVMLAVCAAPQSACYVLLAGSCLRCFRCRFVGSLAAKRNPSRVFDAMAGFLHLGFAR